jgi:murein L,D-transpeptidase YcbB/YkuD
MKRFIITLLLTVALFINSCHKANEVLESKSKFQIVESISKRKLPIVSLDIDGQRYDFLIATMATTSLIDSAAAVNRKLHITVSETPREIITFSDITKDSTQVMLMNQRFYLHNIGKMIKNVQFRSGIKIDGIIGNDIMSNKGCTIDFKNQIISNLNN